MSDIGLLVVAVCLVVAVVLGLAHRLTRGRIRSRGEETVISGEDVGARLGERATVVQFSTAFCSPCRATRARLEPWAAGVEGLAYIDVDAESHLDLVRRLNVMRTPTVLILDARGRVVAGGSGGVAHREDLRRIQDTVAPLLR